MNVNFSSDVNGVTSKQGQSPYKKTSDIASKDTKATQDEAAVYESGKDRQPVKKVTYEPNTALINKLKSDAEERSTQLRNLVEKVICGQAGVFASDEDYWKFLASGKYTVDAKTREEAKASIAEDGYWGVEQTSDRIIQFATALTGGNPDKLQEMADAFKKGFELAKKTWGGNLPDISNRTYSAVMEKFKKIAEDNGIDLRD